MTASIKSHELIRVVNNYLDRRTEPSKGVNANWRHVAKMDAAVAVAAAQQRTQIHQNLVEDSNVENVSSPSSSHNGPFPSSNIDIRAVGELRGRGVYFY